MMKRSLLMGIGAEALKFEQNVVKVFISMTAADGLLSVCHLIYDHFGLNLSSFFL